MNIKVGEELAPGWWLKTIEEGADTPVYLSLLPPNAEGPKGKFLAERKGRNQGIHSNFWEGGFFQSSYNFCYFFITVLDWENHPSIKETFAIMAAAKAERNKEKIAVVCKLF